MIGEKTKIRDLALKIVNEDRKIIWITGAGVSVSAGIPLWNEMRDKLYSLIFNIASKKDVESKLIEKLSSDDVDWIKDNLNVANSSVIKEIGKKVNEIKKANKSLLPEFVMAFYLNQYGLRETAKFYEGLFKDYRISPTYTALIKLYELGIWKYYLTFNLDNVIERVFNFYNIPFFSINGREVSNGSIIFPYMATIGAFIFNIHGNYTHPTSLEVSHENILRSQMDNNKKDLLIKIFENEKNPLVIIIGYSGNEQYFINSLEKEIINFNPPVYYVDIVKDNIKNFKNNTVGSNSLYEKVCENFICSNSDEFMSTLLREIIRKKTN